MIRDGLASAEAAIADIAGRDNALPALPVLLDPRRLAELLGSPLTVERVRYKHGASVVVAVRFDSGDRGWVVSYTHPEKLAKNELRAREAGLDATPHGTLTLSGPAAADRVLAHRIARLARIRPGLLDDSSVVRYNPHRRLVLRAGGLAVKISGRPAVAGDRTARALAHAGLPVLAPTAIDRHVSTTPWWGTGDLVSRPELVLEREAGRMLAALHATDPSGFGGLPSTSARDETSAAVRALTTVLPELGARAARIAERIDHALGAAEHAVLLHGDWSLDQVLSDGRDVRLIDFDRVAVGPAGRDLGSALAAGASDAMIAGYTSAGGAVDPLTLPAWTALSLLQRAIDPFRELREDWPAEIVRVVDRAEEVLS